VLNSRDVARLRPDMAANCRIWMELCKRQGLEVLITSTVRDQAYQTYLYAQGRTRPGQIVTKVKIPTFHSDKAGLAFDFCKNVKGHEYDDTAFFRRAADIAKQVGFSWGGDWKSFVDMPHIQWDEGGRWTGSMILAGRLPAQMPLFQMEENEDMVRYDRLEQCPAWAQGTVKKLIDKGFLSGGGQVDDEGLPQDLDLSHDMVRLLVIQDRAGVFGK